MVSIEVKTLVLDVGCCCCFFKGEDLVTPGLGEKLFHCTGFNHRLSWKSNSTSSSGDRLRSSTAGSSSDSVDFFRPNRNGSVLERLIVKGDPRAMLVGREGFAGFACCCCCCKALFRRTGRVGLHESESPTSLGVSCCCCWMKASCTNVRGGF